MGGQAPRAPGASALGESVKHAPHTEPERAAGTAAPSVGNEGGELPDHVAAEPIKGVLKDWDVAKTDALLQKFEARAS